MRKASIERNTKETRITGTLKIEGRGVYNIQTGIRFFDHMLELFAKHGGFDLKLHADGDLDVDQHHTVEDSGIVLGQLFSKALADRRISAYVATGKAKHPTEIKRKVGGPLTQAMRTKLKRAAWRSRYRLRKQIVEPVFGQIKQARGFRQFLLRGIEKVKAEWAMICTAHNLTKLARVA